METTKKYIAYLRVSTRKQSLGLEAQLNLISSYCANKGTLIATFSEKESGKKDSRGELAKAIALAKKEDATIVVAKLDRLSRSVKFLFEITEQNVKFECCNLPELNTLTLGMFAALAQHERELISERTKQALAVKKQQGIKLGRKSPVAKVEAQKANAASQVVRKRAKETKRYDRTTLIVLDFHKQGLSRRQIVVKAETLGLDLTLGKVNHIIKTYHNPNQ